MKGRLKPRQQGDLGELSAMEWLTGKGACVFKPVFHSPDVDLVADLGGRLIAIEVKTSTHVRAEGRWGVLISTRGGNQSWNGTTKYFDPARCDFVFVHVGDGRRWFIPTGALECRSGLTLGGPKYAEFEIEQGWELVDTKLESTAPPGERRSWRAGPVCKIGASVLSEFDSHLPHLPERAGGPACSTTVSANHQVTIPTAAFGRAGLRVGERLSVEADGAGRIILSRMSGLVERQLGLLGEPGRTHGADVA
jgi:hypothetical protein